MQLCGVGLHFQRFRGDDSDESLLARGVQRLWKRQHNLACRLLACAACGNVDRHVAKQFLAEIDGQPLPVVVLFQFRSLHGLGTNVVNLEVRRKTERQGEDAGTCDMTLELAPRGHSRIVQQDGQATLDDHPRFERSDKDRQAIVRREVLVERTAWPLERFWHVGRIDTGERLPFDELQRHVFATANGQNAAFPRDADRMDVPYRKRLFYQGRFGVQFQASRLCRRGVQTHLDLLMVIHRFGRPVAQARGLDVEQAAGRPERPPAVRRAAPRKIW